MCGSLGGAGAWPYLAKHADVAGGNSSTYLKALLDNHRDAKRAIVLAKHEGVETTALNLLKSDPKTQGAKLFAQHCASCHRYGGHDGLAHVLPSADNLADLAARTNAWERFASSAAVHPDWLARKENSTNDWDTVKSILVANEEAKYEILASTKSKEAASAPDLKGFASRKWIRELLTPEKYISHKFFGGSAHKDGDMYRRFLKRKVAKYDDEEKEMLELVVLALSAEAKLPSQAELDKADAEDIKKGIDHLIDDIACIDCHAFQEPDPDVDGPDLTGYGSRQWIIDFVKNPEHEKFYPENNDRMPAFGEKGILTDDEIGLIADWIREDYFIDPKAEDAAH
ncbi:MAG: c-type cytochrome, partial [Verrucomicrobiales bacterium]|nr:c-type cytochrome [Verrucomicrobiales bacterium]